MAEAKKVGNGRRHVSAVRTPQIHAKSALRSTHADLATFQAGSVLSPHFEGLAAQLALPTSRYKDLLATMSISGPPAQAAAANQTAIANLAVQGWSNNPTIVEATQNCRSRLPLTMSRRCPSCSRLRVCPGSSHRPPTVGPPSTASYFLT